MGKCIFCEIVSGKIPCYKVYENEDILAFMDIEPINGGHVLIIPKEHKLDLDELTDKESADIMQASKLILRALKKVYPFDGYSIMQNGGDFNDIGHYHMHIFPRYHGDGFGWKFGEFEKGNLEEECNKIKKELFSM